MTGNQLREAIRKMGITQDSAAESLGITRRTLQNWFKLDQLDANISQNVKDNLDIDMEYWSEESILRETPMYYGGEDSVLLPLIPIDAVAGFPTNDFNGVTLADCEQYIIPEFSTKGAEFLIRVGGSSMYPKYSNGDLLACKKVPAITFFQWGKVYVLDTVQGALVKRIFPDNDNPDCVICQSDNKEKYPPFSLPKEEIRSLSIVLGVIGLE